MGGGSVVDLLGDYRALTLRHVARGLSRLNRFVGQTETKITVAQHSVLVSRICGKSFNAYQQQGLLHDAHEVLTGDIPSPVKVALEERFPGAWNAFEQEIAAKVRHRFGMPQQMAKEVKQVDEFVRRVELFNVADTQALNSYQSLGLAPYPHKIQIMNEEESYLAFLSEAVLLGLYERRAQHD